MSFCMRPRDEKKSEMSGVTWRKKTHQIDRDIDIFSRDVFFWIVVLAIIYLLYIILVGSCRVDDYFFQNWWGKSGARVKCSGNSPSNQCPKLHVWDLLSSLNPEFRTAAATFYVAKCSITGLNILPTQTNAIPQNYHTLKKHVTSPKTQRVFLMHRYQK